MSYFYIEDDKSVSVVCLSSDNPEILRKENVDRVLQYAELKLISVPIFNFGRPFH